MRRCHSWCDCSRWLERLNRNTDDFRPDIRRRECERDAQQRDHDDRGDERPCRPHRATEDLDAQIGEPRTPLVPASTVRDRRQDDPLVEVRRGWRSLEPGHEPDQSRGAPELRGARGASSKMAGEPGSVGLRQLVDEIRVDEAARGDVVDRLTGVTAHTSYMTRGCGKVAGALQYFRASTSRLNPARLRDWRRTRRPDHDPGSASLSVAPLAYDPGATSWEEF